MYVVFTVATSCKLWIVKLAHTEELLFTQLFTENSNKKSVGLPGGNINVIQNFCRSCLIIKRFIKDNYFLSEKKLDVLFVDIN